MHDPYVSTFLGNRIYLTRPHIDDVAIEDIAHGLAYQCRFNGQTQDFYSVAQHSLIVMHIVPEEHRLAGTLQKSLWRIALAARLSLAGWLTNAAKA